MRARELLAEPARLGVDDEVDVALAVQRHVLAAVARTGGEAHAREQPAQQLGVRRRVLDELESVGAHRVVEQVRHGRHYNPRVNSRLKKRNRLPEGPACHVYNPRRHATARTP